MYNATIQIKRSHAAKGERPRLTRRYRGEERREARNEKRKQEQRRKEVYSVLEESRSQTDGFTAAERPNSTGPLERLEACIQLAQGMMRWHPETM